MPGLGFRMEGAPDLKQFVLTLGLCAILAAIVGCGNERGNTPTPPINADGDKSTPVKTDTGDSAGSMSDN